MKEKEDGEKIPLKTILTNFLNHVETLEVKREEGEDLYEKEFQVRITFQAFLLGCSCTHVYKVESSCTIHGNS